MVYAEHLILWLLLLLNSAVTVALACGCKTLHDRISRLERPEDH